MTRIFYIGSSVLLGALFVVLVLFGVANASDHSRYEYRYDSNYDYRSYDNSINRSFNNYDSFNYTYGYPYSNYSYDYPNYTNQNDYNSYYDGYQDYGYRQDYNRRPTCSISTYRTSGANPYDGRVTVSWWSSHATSAYLSGVGSVSPSGSQTLYGSYYSTYTLTVSGPGGSTTCSASSPFYDSGSNRYRHHDYNGYVSSPYFNYPVQTYPYVSGTVYPTAYNYVTLSQVPYTGFDFGLLGNSLYWLAMVLVAAAGAYLIVYSHSGAMPRAFAREVAAAARNQIRFVTTIVR